MLKRNGQLTSRQLSLFGDDDYEQQTTHRIRTDGGTPLEGVPAQDGSGTGDPGETTGSATRSAGDNPVRTPCVRYSDPAFLSILYYSDDLLRALLAIIVFLGLPKNSLS